MIDLTGKSALVTGGSRGIGRAIALRLATQGADVAFSYRGNEAAAKEVVAAIEGLGRRAVAVQADAADPDSAETVVKAALEAFGKVDILVNNAGITRDDLIMRMSVDDFREVLETNLFGAFYMTKAVTRPMLKARSGRIVNITSVSGQAGQMGQANYSSAKAGLIGLTKATARELASRSITCNAVAPGFVLTELTQDLPEALQAELTTRTPLGRFGTPEEIADAVAFLASDEAAVHHGAGARRRRRPRDDVVGGAASLTAEPCSDRRRCSRPGGRIGNRGPSGTLRDCDCPDGAQPSGAFANHRDHALLPLAGPRPVVHGVRAGRPHPRRADRGRDHRPPDLALRRDRERGRRPHHRSERRPVRHRDRRGRALAADGDVPRGVAGWRHGRVPASRDRRARLPPRRHRRADPPLGSVRLVVAVPGRRAGLRAGQRRWSSRRKAPRPARPVCSEWSLRSRHRNRPTRGSTSC